MNKIFEVTPATMDDVVGIFHLVNFYHEKEVVLKRTEENIFQNIASFVVVRESESKKIIGCSSFHIYNPELVEIRSLCVADDYRNQGMGKAMVGYQIDLAKQLKIKSLFTLTVEVDFFKQLQFEVVTKEFLPEKIFKDCIICELKDNCIETAMIHPL